MSRKHGVAAGVVTVAAFLATLTVAAGGILMGAVIFALTAQGLVLLVLDARTYGGTSTVRDADRAVRM